MHESRNKLIIGWPFHQGEFQTLLPRVGASSIAGPWLTTVSHPSTPILSTALCLGFKEKGNLNQGRGKSSVGCFISYCAIEYTILKFCDGFINPLADRLRDS